MFKLGQVVISGKFNKTNAESETNVEKETSKQEKEKKQRKIKNMCDITLQILDVITPTWFVDIICIIIPLFALIYTLLYKFDKVENGLNILKYTFCQNFKVVTNFHIADSDTVKFDSIKTGNKYEFRIQIMNKSNSINNFNRIPQIYIKTYGKSICDKDFLLGTEKNITNCFTAVEDKLTKKELSKRGEIAWITYKTNFEGEKELFDGSFHKVVLFCRIQSMKNFKVHNSNLFNITKFLRKNDFKYFHWLNKDKFNSNLNKKI
jgi:hypothetical protein